MAGNRADDGLYVPAYEAAVTALGTSAVLVLVVGDSTMGALGTRGHIVAGGSCYLCAYRPPAATAELATWREQALVRSATWQWLEKVHPKTGEVLAEVMMHEWERRAKLAASGDPADPHVERARACGALLGLPSGPAAATCPDLGPPER